MREIITNQYFLLALTFGVYFGAKYLQKVTRSIILNPILIAIGLIILFLTATDISYETYHDAAPIDRPLAIGL